MIIIDWRNLLGMGLGFISLGLASAFIFERAGPFWGLAWFGGNLLMGWLLGGDDGSSERPEDEM